MSCEKLINAEDGTARVAGNRTLYVRLLKKFLKTDYMSELRLLMSEDHLAEAMKSVHTIKGVAANLSLEMLHRAALRFETSLKNGALNKEYLADLYCTYEETAKAIESFE